WRVMLRGAILAREVDAALAAVRTTAGVHDVVDQLTRAVSPGSMPGFEGEGRTRRERRAAWPPAPRARAIGGGALLAIYGLLVQRGVTGLALGAAGGGLATRGVINRPLRVGRDGIAVHKTIKVHAPIERVLELWSRLDEFPRFMEHVRSVEVVGKRSRWTVDSIPGATMTFEAETDRERPNMIAWRTLPDQPVEHHGTVRFEPYEDGTRIQVDLFYRPFGGLFGHAVARLFGFDPKRRLDRDLVRMKALLEDGHTRAHHQR